MRSRSRSATACAGLSIRAGHVDVRSSVLSPAFFRRMAAANEAFRRWPFADARSELPAKARTKRPTPPSSRSSTALGGSGFAKRVIAAAPRCIARSAHRRGPARRLLPRTRARGSRCQTGHGQCSDTSAQRTHPAKSNVLDVDPPSVFFLVGRGHVRRCNGGATGAGRSTSSRPPWRDRPCRVRWRLLLWSILFRLPALEQAERSAEALELRTSLAPGSIGTNEWRSIGCAPAAAGTGTRRFAGRKLRKRRQCRSTRWVSRPARPMTHKGSQCCSARHGTYSNSSVSSLRRWTASTN